MKLRELLSPHLEDISTFFIRKLLKEIRAFEDQWNLFDEKEKPQAKANTGRGSVPKNPGEESKRVPFSEFPDPAVIKELKRKVKNICFNTGKRNQSEASENVKHRHKEEESALKDVSLMHKKKAEEKPIKSQKVGILEECKNILKEVKTKVIKKRKLQTKSFMERS